MRSPFTGMDPYLEARWSDVHVKLIVYIAEALQAMLPPGLRARSEERVLLQEESDEILREYRADVAIVRPSGTASRSQADSAGGLAIADPVIVEFNEGPVFDRSVKIIDVTSGNRLITAIEVLTPWNKSAGRLNRSYRRKLSDYARAGASVVEIDLLRSSRGRLKVTHSDLPEERRAPYLACIRKGWLGERWEVYPISLRQPLPAIPVPLREQDPEIRLELQPLIDRVYSAGGHDDIDYRQLPQPALTASDAAWAAQCIQSARPL
jgi:hypothetical protein